MSRRKLLLGGGAALLSASGSALLVSERHLRVTRHTLAWRGPRPLRIAHVTDIHVGWTTPERMLSAAVAAVRDAKPDAVVLTGDYVNHSVRFLPKLDRFVSRLPGPVIATLGNHDHWTDAKEITTVLERAGAQVLANGHAAIDGLTIVGIDDSVTKHHDIDKAFAGAPTGDDILVLTHSPAIADRIAAVDDARLVLSGHTHAGQVRVPVITRAIARRRGMPYLSGAADLPNEAMVYVNAGLGHTRRGLRYGRAAAPEVAIFDLEPRSA